MADKTALPPTVDDVVFVEANSRQRELSWELNGASWAPPMTLDEYVGREKALSETALSANGGTRYWILHPQDNPDLVVSACETTAKKLLVADAKGVRIVDSYSIASVFTAPQYRERGLASHLLIKVQQVVDQTTEGGVLYSDIGRTYYTKLGWADYRSPQVLLHLEEGYKAPAKPDGVSFLARSEIEELCEKDIEALKKKFENLAGTKDGKTHISFLPSFAQCSWHFTRDAYVAHVMTKRDIKHCGARTADGSSWLYWDHDLRDGKLKVQRIVTNPSDAAEKRVADIKALLEATLAEAADWGIPKVLIWAPGNDVGAAVTEIWREGDDHLRVVFEERQDGSIPSLRWNGGKDVGEVVWEDNEYFSWC